MCQTHIAQLRFHSYFYYRCLHKPPVQGNEKRKNEFLESVISQSMSNALLLYRYSCFTCLDPVIRHLTTH